MKIQTASRTSILFVCHGNICRSPMAEFILKDLVQKAGLAEKFFIDSAATSAEEIGNPVYPPAQKILQQHGIFPRGKFARQMTLSDFRSNDYIVLMDENNLRNLSRLLGSAFHWNEVAKNPESRRLEKISLLMDYTDTPRDVADPWYTGNFTATWDDISKGCAGLFTLLRDASDVH